MPDQWIVLQDRTKHEKRFVEIEDTVNMIKYSNYFRIRTSDSDVVARFIKHVQEKRAEISRNLTTLDLTNFEAGI